jgi:hypothetical protein
LKSPDVNRSLLRRLGEGQLDGFVGDDLTTSGGSSIWKEIRDGIPRQLKQGPSRKFFDGRENTRIEGVRHIQQEWKSDEEKLHFLQKFGWLMRDKEARAYSARFKPKK